MIGPSMLSSRASASLLASRSEDAYKDTGQRNIIETDYTKGKS